MVAAPWAMGRIAAWGPSLREECAGARTDSSKAGLAVGERKPTFHNQPPGKQQIKIDSPDQEVPQPQERIKLMSH